MNIGKALLYDALVSGRGLQSLLDAAAQVLGCPLALCDALWIVRGVSGQRSHLDDVLITNNRGLQHIAPEVISTYDSNDTSVTRSVWFDSSRKFCLIHKIGSQSEMPLAYLIQGSATDKPADEINDFTDSLCHILLSYLRQDGRRSLSLQSVQEIILNNLLDGEDSTELGSPQQAFSAAADCLYFTCVVDTLLGHTLKPCDLLELMNFIDYETMIVRQGRPVLLIRTDAVSLGAFEAARDRLAGQLSILRLRGGIGYPFEQVEDFNLHYLQALKAMEFGRAFSPEKALTAYIDMACLDLVSSSAEGGGFPMNALHPAVQEIIRYDADHGTSYFPTLSACVETSGNIKTCSTRLGVRWSTLNNRVSRIRELFGIDLKDNAVISQLYFSCGIEALRQEMSLQ